MIPRTTAEALRSAAWESLWDLLVLGTPDDSASPTATTGPTTRADGGTAGKTRPSDTRTSG